MLFKRETLIYCIELEAISEMTKITTSSKAAIDQFAFCP
jgi:hypothetical protein